ncbi:GL19785 [Drosophila persimilis]|uniref:GL19785 n=1 Tax=Drosophila persimilis TaxID=7234 RepID=B4GYK1_DROPE|nr:GL19785 [Drosophila persimilis]
MPKATRASQSMGRRVMDLLPKSATHAKLLGHQPRPPIIYCSRVLSLIPLHKSHRSKPHEAKMAKMANYSHAARVPSVTPFRLGTKKKPLLIDCPWYRALIVI